MIPGLTLRVVVKCENCGHELWSNDPDEIEQWKDLEEQDALECSICGGKMRFEKEEVEKDGK